MLQIYVRHIILGYILHFSHAENCTPFPTIKDHLMSGITTPCLPAFMGIWMWCPTPLFLPNGCYLSGAPCQIIIRQLSDACQMSHQTSVNSHQTSVRQVPHINQTCTIRSPDMLYHNVHQMSTRHLPDICQIYGTGPWGPAIAHGVGILTKLYEIYIVACQRGGVSKEPPGQRQDMGPGILWCVHRWTRPTWEPPLKISKLGNHPDKEF